jgi:hypothetical protein
MATRSAQAEAAGKRPLAAPFIKIFYEAQAIFLTSLPDLRFSCYTYGGETGEQLSFALSEASFNELDLFQPGEINVEPSSQ